MIQLAQALHGDFQPVSVEAQRLDGHNLNSAILYLEPFGGIKHT